MIVNIVFFVFVIYFFILVLKNEGFNNMSLGTVTKLNVGELSIALAVHDRFVSNAERYTQTRNISFPQLLSMLAVESGSLIKQGKSNNEILGDNNNSVGFTQISLPAITDVNNRLGSSFTLQDALNDEDINLMLGFTYLYICLLSAENENSKNAVKLAFKKYNGGIDETDYSINPMASIYSVKAMKYYNYYYELLRS